ncbi:GNAT family N-acetyltransferase [Sphingomonas sp. PL-96]|uniref:GNAT family N-acetyltransferase n=1 Tax=Sphingomonas sp. PL-96 TaxID=2887201 RepID=UPI001E626ADE|nr:GNAT family N-acetyltransferase [Sphingomonas sp. PL-96]MCC2977864.1 GNAT family N-acetyltransferase [Sphingomonas sp. PL-96]
MIETERLILSRPTLADFEANYTMFGDERVTTYLGGPMGREDSWKNLLRNIGHWAAFGYGIFALHEKQGRRLVGQAGLAHFQRGFGDAFDPYPEAAWVIAADAQGKGYATEAVQAVHGWLAVQRDPGRTVCLIHPDNQPSRGVAAKLGYQPFGEVRHRDAPGILFARG